MRLIFALLLVVLILVPLLSFGGSEDTKLGTATPALLGVLLLFFAVLLNTWSARSEREREDPELRDRYFLASLMAAGFLVRVLVAALIHSLSLYDFIAPDEQTFHRNGLQFCQWLQGDTPFRLSVRFLDTLQVGYYYLVGGIYFVFGEGRFLPVLVNCAVGTLTALPAFKIAKELGGRKAARPTAVLVTFFPSVLLWSTLLIRDTIVIFLLLHIIAAVMDLRRAFSVRQLVLLVLLLVGVGTLRQYLFVIVAVTAVVSVLVGRSGRTGRSVLLGIVAILAMFVVVRYAGFGVAELERASLHHLNLQRQYNSSVATAAGSIRPEIDISEPMSAVTYLPVGMTYFLLSPFPWQVLSSRQAMALPDMILWYLLLYPVLLGIGRAVRTRFRDAAMLLLTISAITILYSLVEGNVGIIFRHRAQILVPAMVFAGMGLAIKKERKEKLAAEAKALAEKAREMKTRTANSRREQSRAAAAASRAGA